MEWVEVAKVVGTQGVFAVLFVWLSKRYFEKNDTREAQYHQIIHENNTIIEKSTDLMKTISDKYDDLDEKVTEGFEEVRRDIKDLYKEKCGD